MLRHFSLCTMATDIDASTGVFKNEVGGGQVPPTTIKTIGPQLSTTDNIDSLLPWLSLGCCSLFLYLDWPSCFGCVCNGDFCCCSFKQEWCRILCGGVDQDEPVRPCCFNMCGEDWCSCSAHPDSTDSHSNLKKYPNDWFSCAHVDLKCGDCKTLCALRAAVCCLELRCAVPTNSRTTVPWMVNFLGFTFNYQWSMPMVCCASIGDLKEQTAGNIHRTSMPRRCENIIRKPQPNV